MIDHARGEIATTVETGESPTGAVAGTVRPDVDASQRVLDSLSTLGVDVGEREMSFCPDGNCYCG